MNQHKSKYTPRQAKSLLKQCRQENITYEMALTAISWNFYDDEDLIKFVPIKFRTEELCLKAIGNAKCLGFVYNQIPNEILNIEFAVKAVSINGLIIQFFPTALLTEQVALEAVNRHLSSIKYVPNYLITQNFFAKLLYKNRDCLKIIPKEYRTRELLLKAVELYPYSIKHIKEDELDYEICKFAVTKNWQVLRLIPNKFKTNEICDIAYRINHRAAKYVSNSYKSAELCLQMVKEYPEYIEKCPDTLINETFYLKCIEENWECIRYIKDDFKTQKICNLAIQKNKNAIRYIPISFLSESLCINTIKQDVSSIELLPDECKTKSVCELALKLSTAIIRYVPEQYRTAELYLSVLSELHFSNHFMEWLLCDDTYLREQYFIDQNLLSQKEIIQNDFYRYINFQTTANLFTKETISNYQCAEVERALNLRIVKESEYDKEQQIFIVYEFFYKNSDIKFFKNFDDYYNYLGGNLTGANLTEYPTENLDKKKYNLNGAILSSRILKNQNNYDDKFYKSCISSYTEELNFLPALVNESVPACSINHAEFLNDKLNPNERKIYYISDLHLNHRLIKAFPHSATIDEVKFFIRKIIRKMVSSHSINSDDFLLIGGDVSFCFEISKIFYSELTQFFSANKIIVILGNHELWNFDRFGNDKEFLSLSEIIQKYSDLFKELKITFLHNSLLIRRFNKEGYQRFCKIDYETLLALTIDDLRKLGLESNLFIWGGLGFSGYNLKFNATNGIYRQTITTLEDDLKLTKQFEEIYLKLEQAFSNDKVIVFTHTPKEDWSQVKNYNPNWIFVNGHTHKNYYIQNEEKTIYADNQIGYSSMNYNLKYFKLNKDYNIFKDYADGIHSITKEQYLDFNYGIGIRVSFSRECNEIIMLKKNGYFLFLAQNADKSRLYLLNGGIINRLKITDINYYFENMTKYGDTIKANLKSYNSALKMISEKVKLLGGDGTVHGCIVDVNFYNHIYLNPNDGTITPYYSPMFGEQQVYTDIPKLLEEQCPNLYKEYLKLLTNGGDSFAVDISKSISNNSVFVNETEQYRPSRLIKNLQFITENKVIRIWNEDFIAGKEIDLAEDVKQLKNRN